MQEGTSLSCWLEASVLTQFWHNIFRQAFLRILPPAIEMAGISFSWFLLHVFRIPFAVPQSTELLQCWYTTLFWRDRTSWRTLHVERQASLSSCGPRGFWRRTHELLKSSWHFSQFLKLLLTHSCCIALLQHKDPLPLIMCWRPVTSLTPWTMSTPPCLHNSTTKIWKCWSVSFLHPTFAS